MMKKLLFLTFSLFLAIASIAQVSGDYQSKASGDWTTPATWETYNGLGWAAAVSPPDPATMTTSNTITIQSPDAVTFTLSVGLYGFNPMLTVNSGGVLSPTNTGTSELAFASAVVVSGDLLLTGDISVTLDASSSMLINSTGKVTVSGTLVNNSSLGTGGLVIKSASETSTGSLIYTDGNPLATVERYVPKDGWHFVAPVTSGVTAQDFYIDANNSAWLTSWDEPSGSWSYFVDPLTDALLPGFGFSYWWQDTPAREMTTPGTVEFKGALLGVTVPLVRTLTAQGTGDNTGFNLIGNPWPCSMQLTPGLADNLVDVEATIWVWNNGANSGNGWFEWASTGTSSGPDINPIEMDPAVIAIGQSVFMRAIADGGTVTYDGDARIHMTDAQFWKNSETVAEDQVPIIQVRVSNGDFTDKAYIAFGEGGSTGFENGYDVTKMFGGELNTYVYLQEENHNYAQNYLSELYEDEERVVDVYVRPGTEGTHTLAVNMEYMPEVEVTLEDTQTDQMVTMNNDVVYTFEATSGDSEDRFKMHFVRTVTGIENPGAQENAVNIYAYNKAVYISNMDNSTYETAQVSIFDMYGREIYSAQTRIESNTRIPVNINNSYLIVRVTNGGNTYTEKVFVK